MDNKRKASVVFERRIFIRADRIGQLNVISSSRGENVARGVQSLVYMYFVSVILFWR